MSRLVSFLFWNVGKQPIPTRIARLAAEHDVDVLMLAECEVPAPEMLRELNQGGKGYCFPFSEAERIMIFTRFPETSLLAVFDDLASRLTVRELLIDGRTGLLLAVVHFHSRVNWTEDDQLVEATNLARDIIDFTRNKDSCPKTAEKADENPYFW